jgi:hypothetical protein
MCVMMVHDNTGEIKNQSLIRRRWLQLGKHGWRPGRSRTADLRVKKCRQGVDASSTPTFYILLSSASARESTSNSSFGTATGL